MSQNVTLPTMVSPAQSLAVAALVNGSTVTQAAEKAGVARETVSRWVHRDPAFIAELQNTRAEIAAGTRCAWRRSGCRRSRRWPTRFGTASCSRRDSGRPVRCSSCSAPTGPRRWRQRLPEEVDLRLRQRAEELRKSERELDASEAIESRCIDVDSVVAVGTVTPDASEAIEGRASTPQTIPEPEPWARMSDLDRRVGASTRRAIPQGPLPQGRRVKQVGMRGGTRAGPVMHLM